MTLQVLGSSSSGNGYILSNGKECLILEAGVDFKKVQQSLDFNTSIITGCLVTHEHGDHAKYFDEYLKNAVDMYASQGTLSALGARGYRCMRLTSGRLFKIGGFNVLPFKVNHDAAEPLGFLIRHKDMGTLLFATDTYYLANRFAGLNHIMIECNYAIDILTENEGPAAVKNRIYASHMELETCKGFLRANDLSQVSNIVLLHLSRDNGDKRRFKREIEGLTGKAVIVAAEGVSVGFGVDDF